MTPTKSHLEKALEIVNAVNKEWPDETFVSDGYGYFDDMSAAISKALSDERERAIEECARVCERNEAHNYLGLCEMDADAIRALLPRKDETK